MKSDTLDNNNNLWQYKFRSIEFENDIVVFFVLFLQRKIVLQYLKYKCVQNSDIKN